MIGKKILNYPLSPIYRLLPAYPLPCDPADHPLELDLAT